MKKIVSVLLCAFLIFIVTGCDSKEKANTKSKLSEDEIVEKYYNYVKDFHDKENIDVYKLFADVNNDNNIEMFFGYVKDNVNYVTLLYLKDNEIVNPGFISNVNMACHYLMDLSYNIVWVLYSGPQNTANEESRYYDARDFLKDDFDVNKIEPMCNGNIYEFWDNYSFPQSYPYIGKVTFDDTTISSFKYSYEEATNDKLIEKLGEEQMATLRESIDKKNEAKKNASSNNGSSNSGAKTFKVGDYDVKFGKYKWTLDSITEYYTLNSDYTCTYIDNTGKSFSCTFKVGTATDGQDISTAVEKPAIIIKGEVNREYFPMNNGFRDTDIEEFIYIG